MVKQGKATCMSPKTLGPHHCMQMLPFSNHFESDLGKGCDL